MTKASPHAILRGRLRRKLCPPGGLGLSWAPAGTLGKLHDSPPGQGPLEPREASVSLNPSCAAGKQRHSPPRPAAASSRFGCRLRAARARLARGLLGGGGGGGAGRGGAARPRAKKERAGPGRGAAPGPAPARSAADDDVPGSCFARVLPKTISIVTRSSGSGPCKPEDFGGPAGVDLGQVTLRSPPLLALQNRCASCKVPFVENRPAPRSLGDLQQRAVLPRCLPRAPSPGTLPQHLLSHYLKIILIASSTRSPFFDPPPMLLSSRLPPTLRLVMGGAKEKSGVGGRRGVISTVWSREWRVPMGWMLWATWSITHWHCLHWGYEEGCQHRGALSLHTELRVWKGGDVGLRVMEHLAGWLASIHTS